MMMNGPRGDWDAEHHGPQTFKDKLLKHKAVIFIAVSELCFIIFFAIFAEYGESAKPREVPHHLVAGKISHETISRAEVIQINETTKFIIVREEMGKPRISHEVNKDYALFQDVHVMIFIGFGFLMTFLKKYAYSAVSINLLLAAYVVQWHAIFFGWFNLSAGHKFSVDLESLFLGEFCAGAILISMGALLGKLSPIQYLVMAFFETIFYSINEYVVFEVLAANDVGGSMNLHTFGAYFGLTIAIVIYDFKMIENENEGTVYYSNIFSIIGCLFLWIYWPSFNAAIVSPDDARLRAIINTYFSLAACTLSTFAFSAMFHRKTQFDMDLIQNATLAGGVAVGSSANLFLTPAGSIIVGSLSGIISVAGFQYLQPFLEKKIKLHDTCGVHNLHGMPGILGGLTSIVLCAMANTNAYAETLGLVLPATANTALHGGHGPGNRTPGQQAGFQAAALVCSLAFAIVGGLITGFILKIKAFDNLETLNCYYNDDIFFDVTEDFAEMGRMIEKQVAESRRRSSVPVVNFKEKPSKDDMANLRARVAARLPKTSEGSEMFPSDVDGSDKEDTKSNSSSRASMKSSKSSKSNKSGTDDTDKGKGN